MKCACVEFLLLYAYAALKGDIITVETSSFNTLQATNNYTLNTIFNLLLSHNFLLTSKSYAKSINLNNDMF